MKEVTYEDWQENPTPRMMWVWDFDVKNKEQAKVISVIKPVKCCYPVLATMSGDVEYETFCHCAEIKKQRRMTNKELSRWLREKTTREYKYKKTSDYVYSFYEYKECHADEELDDSFLIREDDGEWREPLVET